MRIKVFIILFLFVSAFLIISNGNLHMKNSDEAKKFTSAYYSWLLATAGKIFKATAFVVKFDWLPGKETNTNVTKSNISNITNSSK